VSIPFCQCFASLAAALSCRLHWTLLGVHAPRGLNARIILKLKCCSSLWRNSVRERFFPGGIFKTKSSGYPLARAGSPSVTRIRESLDLEDGSEGVQKAHFNTTLKSTFTHQIFVIQKIKIWYLHVFNKNHQTWMGACA